MKYEDFILQIGVDRGGGYNVHVVKSPAGEGESCLRLPFQPDRQGELLAELARSVENPRKPEVEEAGRELDLDEPNGIEEKLRLTPRQLGDQLFRALFSGQVRSLFDQSLGMLRTVSDRGLRIKLKLNPRHPELARLNSLPWEFLHRADTEDDLSLTRKSPIVRYLDVPRPYQPPPLPDVLRILVVISSPTGHRQLDLAREQRELKAAWGDQENVDVVFLPRADLETLHQVFLEQPIHVLHFMGHGGFAPRQGEGVLYFEGPNREATPVSGRLLATELKDCGDLRLVFLNACNTARATAQTGLNPFAGVATALVMGGLPAVLAMQFPISDRAAIAFSKTFYRRLAVGEPADTAVVEGRLAIYRRDPRSMEWGTPVLLMRSPDGRLFEPPARAAPSPIAGRLAPSVARPLPGRRWMRLGKIAAVFLVVLGLLAVGLKSWRSLMPKATLPDFEIPDNAAGESESPGPSEPSPGEEREAPDEEDKSSSSPASKQDRGPPADTKPPNLPDKSVDKRDTPEQRPAPAPPRLASGTQSITESITGMSLWYVRRGSYMVGSPESEPLRDPNEFRHSVRLTYDFWIGETEVTQQQWMKITGHNPARFADMAKYPVEQINWYEAVEFANRLSVRSNRDPCYVLQGCQGRLGAGLTCGEVTFVGLDCTGYRLPTEAEWEIAARAGSTEPFSTGSTLTPSQANYDGARPYPPGAPSAVYHGRPVEVNHYQPNAWGLHQMHGNLYEWTWDRFAPYSSHKVTDPTGPQEGDKRVARGGSYRSGARLCRSAARWGVDPGKRSKEIGLRLVRTAQ